MVSRGAPAAPGSIYVFPTPGSRFATPQTQISFRDTQTQPTITVIGSKSGPHTGTMLAHSDGQGWSFVPTQPFSAGETITVSGPPNIFGSHDGVFHFSVATPAGRPGCTPHSAAPRVPGDVLTFHSRPDLQPANVRVLKNSPGTAPGDFFAPPAGGPVQWGPMIIGPRAGLIWFKPVPQGQWAADLQVQRYRNSPVLTWWQGCTGGGVGQGQAMIYDSSYRKVAVIPGANGLPADLHELKITPQGTALITAYSPVTTDATSVHGAKNQDVLDAVVQEIDIRSCQRYSRCLVLFEWHSLDHVPLTDSLSEGPAGARAAYDYFHVNSVNPDKDGQLVISSRNTWTAYKVSHKTGGIIWRLGGKHSNFTFGPGASFAFQHDVEVRASGDQFITLFDNGAGPPAVRNYSRGLKLRLDRAHHTATMQTQYLHSNPSILSWVEGNTQQLPNLDAMVGWGANPYFSEFDRNGQLLFDARFVGDNAAYRVYKYPWTGTPKTSPDIAASDKDGRTDVYASWNGATEVSSWRVLGGSSASSLSPLKVVSKRGFETATGVPHEGYVAVQALDRSGHVLGQSQTVRPS